MVKEREKKKIGIVDTMFSRIDMGAIALDELKKAKGLQISRRTVPGIKDIGVECKRLIEEDDCDACLALGYVGGAEIDKQCAHEASLAIMQAKLLTNKHILEAFVFEDEAWNETELLEIAENRVRKHAQNAVAIVKNPKALTKFAGRGIRQGKEDEGEIEETNKKFAMGVVVSEFNKDITGKMESIAKQYAEKRGITINRIIKVPGAYDIPLAAKRLLSEKDVDAIVTLGAILKGETKHDEVIAQSTAMMLSQLACEFRKPVALGIIGPKVTWEQASERAEGYTKRAIDAAIKLYEAIK
ncbi:MAG: riboflavin synthase [Candidatus Aenigmarchaeota archaeon]|nr:riboflavin synthase [Candidatus Aenigmarchaeota archaeon]